MKKSYSNDKIEVSFDSDVCQHAAMCVKGLNTVFNPKARPWINVDAADAEKIAEVVKTCPSGALQYKMLDQKEE